MAPKSAAVSKAHIGQCVRERLDVLLGLTFDELSILPASVGETLAIVDRPVERWTYVQHQSSEELRVIVQFAAERTPGSSFGQSYAEGFCVRRDGTQVMVVAPEIYEFW